MLPVLLGVPGKLKTLLDRWTQAKADYLNGYISNCAQASSAVSNAYYTNARGGYLEYLNIGGNVASAASVAAIPTTPINRIQAVSVYIGNSSLSGTATITAVTVAKTIIVPAGQRWDNTTQPDSIAASDIAWTLTNTTTVTATRGRDVGICNSAAAFVVEFK
jgi:hypothetical protein